MHARRSLGRRESFRRLRSTSGREHSRGQYLTRLRVEPLEDRRMLSVLMVDADAPAGGNGLAWPTAYNDLQPALAQAAALNADAESANDVDQIWIAEGTYKPSAKLEPADARSASFSLVNGVTLYGGFAGTESTLGERDWSAHVTTLSGDLGTPSINTDNAYTVVYCTSGITSGIDGVSISGGYANGQYVFSHPERYDGGGIYSIGTLTLGNVKLTHNAAGNGGAVYSAVALTITHSVVAGNSAIPVAGMLSMRGGGIYNAGALTIVSCEISDNTAVYQAATDGTGGGIYSSGTLSATDSTFSGSSATRDGGAIYHDGAMTLIRCDLSNNSTISNGSGGGICSVGSNLIVTDCVLSHNTAGTNSRGGGIYTLASSVMLSDSTLSDSSADSGGGAYLGSSATVDITNCTFSDNSADVGSGGAVYALCSVEITDSILSGNMARGYGGGVYSTKALTVMNSTLLCNSAVGDDYGRGGAVYCSSVLTIANSTAVGNTAVGSASAYGGAVCSSGTLAIRNSTVSGNSAVTRIGVSGYGGGISSSSSTATLNNTIVAGNTGYSASDIYDSSGALSGSNNLVGDGSGQSTLIDGVSGNQVGTASSPIDPLLSGSTQFDNGMWGCYLLPGSPALDAGDNGLALDPTGQPLAEDITGRPRVQNSVVDIGAVEGATMGVAAHIFTVTSLDNVIATDGHLTFIEAFEAANRNQPVGDAPAGSFTERDVIRFADALGGTALLDQGQLDIAGDLSIEGPGSQSLTILANGQSRAFSVWPGVSASLAGMTITGGSAMDGGAICNFGELIITNVMLFGNTATGDYDACGGAICSTGTLTVLNATLTGNSVTGTRYSLGGGIFSNNGTTSVTNSTLSNNSANARGGGIFSFHGIVAVVNSLFSHNSASYGGGIDNESGTLAVANSTFMDNSGNRGGGVYAFGVPSATTTLNNAILSGNTAPTGPDVYCSSGTLSGSCNLIGNGSGQTALVNGVDGNQVGTADSPIDPLLSAAGMPLPGSPAINKGSNALAVDAEGNPLVTDLGGDPRIRFGAVDIGAYEYWQVLTPEETVPGDANLDGAVDGADATHLASHWGLSGMAWIDGDFNGDGRVNAADAAILAANWGTTFTPPSESQGPAGELAAAMVGPMPAGTSGGARRLVEPIAERSTKDEGRRTKEAGGDGDEAIAVTVGQAVPDAPINRVAADSVRHYAVDRGAVESTVRHSLTYAVDRGAVEPTVRHSLTYDVSPDVQRSVLDGIAWSHTLARRQPRRAAAGDVGPKAAAVDVVLSDSRLGNANRR